MKIRSFLKGIFFFVALGAALTYAVAESSDEIRVLGPEGLLRAVANGAQERVIEVVLRSSEKILHEDDTRMAKLVRKDVVSEELAPRFSPSGKMLFTQVKSGTWQIRGLAAADVEVVKVRSLEKSTQ